MTMRIGGIVLARMDSSRLPGKHLRELKGRPLLDWLFDRAKAIRGLDDLVLATSDRPVDDPLHEFAQSRGIACFRGSVEDVAGRVLACAKSRSYDAWARINGDSPLLDFELFTSGIVKFRSGEFDIVTNVLHRSYPVGNSMEIFSTRVFEDGYVRFEEPAHHEHVTLYFYEQGSRDYRIFNLTRKGENCARLSVAVDTVDDFSRFGWIIEQVGFEHLNLRGDRLVELARKYDQQRNRGSEGPAMHDGN